MKELLVNPEKTQVQKPRVCILIGADNNTMLVNGEKVRFISKSKHKGRLTRNNIDAIFLLNYLHRNPGRMLSHRELMGVFENEIKQNKPADLESRSDSYLRNRVKGARNLLLNRLNHLRLGDFPLIASQETLQGMEIGAIHYELSVERVLIDLKDYPYPFNHQTM